MFWKALFGGTMTTPSNVVKGATAVFLLLAVLFLPVASRGASSVYIIGVPASSGPTHGYATFIAGQAGNWTVPAGVDLVNVTMWGGGGAGATSDGVNDGTGGGGGGGVIYGYALSVTSGQNIPYSVGTGGAAVSSWPHAGYPGGNTTFGNLIAYGGSGGNHSYWDTDHHGGPGGAATDGTYTANGGTSNASGNYNGYVVVAKGLWGGGAGGDGSIVPSNTAGSSLASGGTSYNGGLGGGGGSFGVGGYGGSGLPIGVPTAGVNGAGGGSSFYNGTASGAGGDGQIRLVW